MRVKPASIFALSATAIFVAVWIVPAVAATSEAPAPPRLGAFGNDRILWVFRSDTSPQGARLVRSVYRAARGSPPGTYGTGQTVVGNVARAAVRGVSLHVFFDDGTHRRFAPRAAGAIAPTDPRVFTEVNLPDAVIPRALAGDMATNVLYAVVPATVATKVAQEQEERVGAEGESAQSVDAQPDPPGEPTSTRPPVVTFKSAVGMVRYSHGQWFADRDGPAQIGDDARILALVAHDRRLHLFYRSGSAKDKLQHQWSDMGKDDVAGSWSAPSVVALAGARDLVAESWIDDGVELVVANAAKTGLALEPIHGNDAQWKAGPSIDDSSLAPGQPHAVTMFDGKLVVARLTEANNVELALWALKSGDTAEPAHLIPQLISTSGVLSPWTRQIVQYSLLTAILIIVFFWRRECVTFVAPLPPEQTFARLPRRGLAFLIDLLITAPVWASGVYRLWRSVAPGLTPTEQLSAPTGTGSGILFWCWALVGAVFAVYGAIFELALGATAGKRIVGCFVVDEVGRRCRPGAVIIRNLVRILEFHFPALVLLVLFTPSRQRLGDVLARTVVVEPAAVAMPSGIKPPSEDDHSGDDPDQAP